MNPEMMEKMKVVETKLSTPKSMAMSGSQESITNPYGGFTDQSESSDCEKGYGVLSREPSSSILKRAIKRKSERIVALKQLNDLFEAGYIKDGDPLESFLWEFLQNERRY